MSTSMIALAISVVATLGLVVTVALLNLLVGGLDWFKKPNIKILKSDHDHGFAFKFSWSQARWPVSFDRLGLTLLNPMGKPTRAELYQDFSAQKGDFALDFDLGERLQNFFKLHQGADQAEVKIELHSTKGGVVHSLTLPFSAFRLRVKTAEEKVEDAKSAKSVSTAPQHTFGVIHRSVIADTVPGKGPKLKMASNPEFASDFAATGGNAEAASAPAQENFAIAKVWIAEGCIVCNACEDIYPEVFDVQADTCIIKDSPPLDDGLKIQEAAEACPVEVIKYDRAS